MTTSKTHAAAEALTTIGQFSMGLVTTPEMLLKLAHVLVNMTDEEIFELRVMAKQPYAVQVAWQKQFNT